MIIVHRMANCSGAIVLSCIALSCAPYQSTRKTPSLDAEAALSSSAAMTAYSHGDLERAGLLFRQALKRAEVINSPQAISDAAYDLAAVEIADGNYDKAGALLREAEYDASRGGGSTAEIHLLRAKAEFLSRHFAEATKLADDVLAATKDQSLRLQALILKARIDCEAGNEETSGSLTEAIDRQISGLSSPPSSSILADVAGLHGLIADKRGKYADAAASFDRQSELLRSAGRYLDMGHALSRAGDAYASARQTGRAADRLFLAARTLAAQGFTAEAKSLAQKSLSAARAARDDAATDRARGLLDQINAAAP